MPLDEVRRQFYTLCFFLFGIIALIALPAGFDMWRDSSVVHEEIVIVPNEYRAPQKTDPYADLDIVANSALVLDMSRGKVLYEKNSHEIVPLASVTKLMTALVAHEALSDSESIEISFDALSEEGDSGLFAHEKWDPYDLISYTLLVSSNDGAHAVASAGGARILSHQEQTQIDTEAPEKKPRELFIEEMNKTARRLKLEDLHFLNETGLDLKDNVAGAYGSAYDIAKLLAYITSHAPEVLEATRYDTLAFTSLSDLPHVATNTNISARTIPGLIGSKTGYTVLAGGNLAITFDAGLGYPIAVVVLGSTVEDRFSDVEALVWATVEKLAE